MATKGLSDAGAFDTLRKGALTSIPLLSALTFIIVAIKVFRVSGMESTTTVAIVSTADPIALLKGVILTLLPGVLEIMAAASLWLWAGALPRGRQPPPDAADPTVDKQAARDALFALPAAMAWGLTVTAGFTIAWPVFVALAVPVVVTTYVLLRAGFTSWGPPRALRRARATLTIVSAIVATAAIGLLTLAPNPWLPLRTITVAANHTVTLPNGAQPRKLAAYVLSRDNGEASLLLNTPRAVIQVPADDLERSMPLCVPPEGRWRFFSLRASQHLGIDPDNHSPYPQCPQATP